jgi:predicted O-methyltransferase YrrM
MGKRTLSLDDRLYEYLLSVSLRDTALDQALRAETDALEYGVMQIAADQAQFMTLLVRLCGVRYAIEIGTFTGYSALAIARGLPPDGHLIACDVSREWTAIAQRYWQQAGLAHLIELRLAPALDTLQSLIAAGEAGRFDFAFIDADKPALPDYYEACLTLLHTGGLIAIDNVLWGGRVADPAVQDESTRAIRAFNRRLHQDPRVELSLLPIGDGLSLARKRA